MIITNCWPVCNQISMIVKLLQYLMYFVYVLGFNKQQLENYAFT